MMTMREITCRSGPLILPWVMAVMLAMTVTARALNDFLTEHPRLVITTDESKLENLDEEAREKISKAKDLIHEYSRDWQQRFGRLQRHLHITLIPVERQINVSGARAEGVWSWQSFNNEEGTLVLGISGVLYVNINSTIISQEALIAHEASHAFLLTYQPKLLEKGTSLLTYNEGLAEIFSVGYEPKPWRGWDKLLLAHRMKDPFNTAELSAYGRRILNVLMGRPQCPHDNGFFYCHVIREGKVDLDRDLKECTNEFIDEKIKEWMKANPDTLDLRMIRE